MTDTTYTVKGMTCGHCAQAVTTELSKLAGVTSVSVDVPGGQVTVRSDQPVPTTAVAEAVDEAGYELVTA